ncbi:MAG: GntR family transcriptional regulator [Pseudomonadota bacterium]
MSVSEFLSPSGWLNEAGGPRYVQLRNRISDGVAQGILGPGSPLPPEREIAAITELSRVTVRKAIQALAKDGLIIQKQGSGSFVLEQTARIEQSLSRLSSFSEDMARRGKTSSARWLERGLFMPSPEETLVLGLSPEDSVARIARLRMADGQPIAIERASLPTDILPNPLAVETSLYAELEASGQRPVRAMQKISAENLGDQDARLLGVAEGEAGLRIERTSYVTQGRVVEFTRSIYRGDAYHFVAELRFTEE